MGHATWRHCGALATSPALAPAAPCPAGCACKFQTCAAPACPSASGRQRGQMGGAAAVAGGASAARAAATQLRQAGQPHPATYPCRLDHPVACGRRCSTCVRCQSAGGLGGGGEGAPRLAPAPATIMPQTARTAMTLDMWMWMLWKSMSTMAAAAAAQACPCERRQTGREASVATCRRTPRRCSAPAVSSL